MATAAAPASAPVIERIAADTARVGVIGVGHHVYWDQFAGLLDEMHRKLNHFEGLVQAEGLTTVNLGMIDNAETAYAALPAIQAADIDMLFIDMVTYATSATFGVLVRNLDIPLVMVCLQPMQAMDYANGTTYMQLCNDDYCSVPEFAGVALRMGKRVPDVLLGYEDNDPQFLADLKDQCGIAKAIGGLKRARIGHMGHVLEAMLDMHTDPTAITRAFGAHVVQIEPDHIMKIYKAVQADEPDVIAKRETILAFFDTPEPGSEALASKLTEDDLQTAATVSVALDRFIAEKKLDGFAYYYEAEPGTAMRTLVTNLIVGNSLLTSAGFPMCGEFDLKTCIAMFIMDRLGMGGSFAEFHPVDFERNSVLVGHDGPHHIGIADGKPVIRSLAKYHGKPGSGASVEFQLKDGPITMLSIGVNATGGFRFVVAEGESRRGPIPPTGNTNTHGVFGKDVRSFLKRWTKAGPTHHFALGIGHKAELIETVADLLGIECIRVPTD